MFSRFKDGVKTALYGWLGTGLLRSSTAPLNGKSPLQYEREWKRESVLQNQVNSLRGRVRVNMTILDEELAHKKFWFLMMVAHLSLLCIGSLIKRRLSPFLIMSVLDG